jgi:hypothetical protein
MGFDSKTFGFKSYARGMGGGVGEGRDKGRA